MTDLLKKVRPATDADIDLPVFSFSKLDVYEKCPMRYKLHYLDGKRTDDTSLALELGSLLHYILEQKGKMLLVGNSVDYELLNDLLLNGVSEPVGKTQQPLCGVSELKRKYGGEWYKADNASGMNYEQKLAKFDKVLHSEMENTDWSPVLFEHEFRFVWDDKVIIEGYIDRVDRCGDEYRTIDYKTSKKRFWQPDANSSLQFGIYALAMLCEFGTLPKQSVYRLVLLDEEQTALSNGWEQRVSDKLSSLISNIEEDAESGNFEPNPMKLCLWCNYCRLNPNASEYKNECEFYYAPENA